MTDDRAVPRHILFATDLSARSDRAQDRAVMLARAWGARLTVLHAVDVADVPTDGLGASAVAARGKVQRALEAEFAGIGDVVCEIVIEDGAPDAVILDVARRSGCDLVVTGVSGNDSLGHTILGGINAAIIPRAPVPVLVVKARVRAAYRGGVVASDLSGASVPALKMALSLFDAGAVRLFHAFEVPFAGFVEDKAAYARELADTARKAARDFVAAHARGATVTVDVGVGAPASLVADYVARHPVDLVIAGTHGRTGLMSVLLGSIAKAILDESPCDVMVVPSR